MDASLVAENQNGVNRWTVVPHEPQAVLILIANR
jgi:hypothetical protein